jgi:molybdenum cofactor cytidylyltransferase
MEGATTQQRYLTPAARFDDSMDSEAPHPRTSDFAAVLLAAGASTRMGGVPKALLDWEGEPVVRRLVAISERVRLDPVVVVVGAAGPGVRRALAGTRAVVVDHPDWARGRTGSIQSGLASVASAGGVLLWPVDHPFVEAKTVEALLRRAEADPMALWVIPTWNGRGGHPVVLRSPTFRAIGELPADRPLRSLLPAFGPQVVRLPVDDPGVVENVDTPESFREALERVRAGEVDRRWTGG